MKSNIRKYALLVLALVFGMLHSSVAWGDPGTKTRGTSAADPGYWSSDVGMIRAAAARFGRMIVVLSANYAYCGWSQRFQPLIEDPVFLEWAYANRVYLLTGDEGRLPPECKNADDAWAYFLSLSKIRNFPALAIVPANNQNTIIGDCLARNNGETIGGVPFNGTVTALINGLSAYLASAPAAAEALPESPVVTPMQLNFDDDYFDDDEFDDDGSWLFPPDETPVPDVPRHHHSGPRKSQVTRVFATVPEVVPVAEETIVGGFASSSARSLGGVMLDAAGDIYASVALSVGKPGRKGSKVTVAVTPLETGKKLSSKAVYVDPSAGAQDLAVEIKGLGQATLRFGTNAAGETVFSGSVGGKVITSVEIGGEVFGSAEFWLSETFPSSLNGADVAAEYLPMGEPVYLNGSKWSVDKAATVKYKVDSSTGIGDWVVNGGNPDSDKTNYSGLKLSYTAKTGVFKGSFKAHTLSNNGRKIKQKDVSISVTGVYVGGVGCGYANAKGLGAWPIVLRSAR